MKGVKKSEFGLCFLAIWIGRATFLGTNPFAAGLLTAVSLIKEKSFRYITVVLLLIGMYTNLSLEVVLRYGICFFCFISAYGFIEKKKKYVPEWIGYLLSGICIFASGMLQNGLSVLSLEGFIVLSAETLLTLVLGPVMGVGLSYLEREKEDAQMNNEEMISMAIILGCAIYGFPKFTLYEFSIGETISSLFLLIMGYQYGAGTGAVAGCALGILFLLEGQDFALVGSLCLLGVSSGIIRNLGKFITGGTFLLVYASMGLLKENNLLELPILRGVAAAVVIFVLLPSSWIKRIDLSKQNKGEVGFIRQNLQLSAKRKIRDFSDAFWQLSKTFYSISERKKHLNVQDVDGILEDLSERLCRHCEKCNRCVDLSGRARMRKSETIMLAAQENGMILEDDFPEEFAQRCYYYDLFVQETNRGLELAKLNLNWYNHMAESREAIAGQLGEVAQIMKEFSEEFNQMKEVQSGKKVGIKEALRQLHLEVKKIAVLEKRNKRQEIYLNAKTKRGRCITSKEAAAVISQVMGRTFRPAGETKNIISKEYDKFLFVEDTHFKVLTGMARANKDGEEVSGDNYSFVELETGEMILALADGMGSGERACEESQSVVELLEGFMEAGFKEESAIKLINSILVLKSNEQTFSTLDMTVIHLFTGVCNFIKIGASATFLKRKDWVEKIQSTSLPVGVFNQVDYQQISKKLYDGDYIIMVSDGVLDCLEEDDEKKVVEKLIGEINITNPEEMANYILQLAVSANHQQRTDDMTVLVAGIWEKSNKI